MNAQNNLNPQQSILYTLVYYFSGNCAESWDLQLIYGQIHQYDLFRYTCYDYDYGLLLLLMFYITIIVIVSHYIWKTVLFFIFEPFNS